MEINKNINRKKISLVTILASPIKFYTPETHELLYNPLMWNRELLPFTQEKVYWILMF